MTRDELEHAIRAACDIAQDDEIYVFGSQAILGQYPDAPHDLRQSVEVDVSPRTRMDRVDHIDGSLGEGSTFHQAYGFYVHGLPIDEAARLPSRWQDRVIPVCDDVGTPVPRSDTLTRSLCTHLRWWTTPNPSLKRLSEHAVILVVLLACSTSSEPDESVSLHVSDTTVAVNPSTESVDVTLSLTIHNAGEGSIWFHACGTILLRHVGSEWQVVWHTICGLGELDEVEIVAGAAYTTDVRILARLGHGISERWRAPVGGGYVLRVLLRDREAALPGSSRISRTFQLRDR